MTKAILCVPAQAWRLPKVGLWLPLQKGNLPGDLRNKPFGGLYEGVFIAKVA
jgi:hypothetical protein